ncbi:MAG TPA: S-adenosylmethionine:tRNA ribosyltransferase-isomerase, partial [Deltaproteobacteria bacterium]|nr:S-adenosylmethionine:tRNA ribosyltransferase-isomerase [Deltaproteobacteria bacterium]
MYSLTDYDYPLPEALIAQTPSKKRDESRLLLLDRKSGSCSHHHFKDVDELLEPSDVLVINNTEVIPGRLLGKKETGGKVELLILDYADHTGLKSDIGEVVCQCLIKTSKRPKLGTVFHFDQELRAEVIDFEDRMVTVKFIYKGKFEQILYNIGKTPLPPYIKRTEKDIETL